jgi:hypothetical protein
MRANVKPDKLRTRRAFATLTAIALISIVAVGLAAITTLFAADVKRTLRHADDAQLRQLLIAGQLAVTAAPKPGKADVPLPPELQSAGATLAYDANPAPDDAVLRVTVTARMASGRAMTQTLHFIRDGDRWVLRSAEL